MSDTNDDIGLPQAPTAIEEQAQTDNAQTQQETPTGGEEAGKTADSPPETYVLDFGNFADQVPPDEAAFLSQMAEGTGVPAEQAGRLIQNLAIYNQAKQDVQADEWADASRNDAEFGGDNFEANISIANKALKTYGSDALVEMLSTSPMGNNPEVIRFLWKVGQTLSEDRFTGGQPAQSGGFDARDFFPNSNMNP